MLLIEIFALIFLCKKNGELAAFKGLKPRTWKIYTIVAWIIAEFLGCIIGLMMFGQAGNLTADKMPQSTMLSISAVALFAAFGGYLFVRHTLENKPDNSINNDVNEIGVDDLQPPKK